MDYLVQVALVEIGWHYIWLITWLYGVRVIGLGMIPSYIYLE